MAFQRAAEMAINEDAFLLEHEENYNNGYHEYRFAHEKILVKEDSDEYMRVYEVKLV